MSKIRSKIKQLHELMDKIAPSNSGIRVYTLQIPTDAPDSDVERMTAEAKATIPEMDGLVFDSIIVQRSISGDDGRIKYPNGRTLSPGESWTLTGGDIQQCVR